MATELPIQFVDDDPEAVLAGLLSEYHTLSGKTLLPGDPERLLLSTVAYQLAHQRSLINFAARMNLVAYATGAHLDALAELVGVTRLGAVPATTTLRFWRVVGHAGDITIPQGTRGAAGTAFYFATDEEATLEAANTFVDVSATATASGAAANKLLSLQVNNLIDLVAGIDRVENLETTTGGADVEDDEALRARIKLAPNAFTVAGPREMYRALALASHSDVDAAGVFSPSPGVVRVVPVGEDGEILDQSILDAVETALSAEDVRPLNDFVEVVQPTVVGTTIELTYYASRAFDLELTRIQDEVVDAVDEFEAWQTGTLGRDHNPAELVSRIMAVVGVKRVEIVAPVYLALQPWEIADVTNTNVTYGGLEDV